MKTLLTAVALLILSATAYAACTTQTITGPTGQTITCTTCCFDSGNCVTNCF